MIIRYKNTEYRFPSTLADITLGKRIDFYQQHGQILDERIEKVTAIEDPFSKEIEMDTLQLEIAARTLSFYTGIPFTDVSRDIDLPQLLAIYNEDMLQLFQEEKETELQQEYTWNEEKWTIAIPELYPNSSMTLNEFIHSKEVVRQLNAIGKNRWEVLPYLCCVYLRKEGEAFSENFVVENSERYQLMLTLPLNIAVAVGFFLSSTLNIYTSALASSIKESQRESIPPATSIDGDGKPS